MRGNLLVLPLWHVQMFESINQDAGTIVQIGGIECYVATPQGDYAKDKVILFLADAFGLSLVNNKVGYLVHSSET